MADPFVEKVISVVAAVKHIAPERISLDSSLQDLGFDSLDATVLMFDLEKRFQISIPDEKVRSVRTVRDILKEVQQLTASPSLDSAPPLDPAPPEDRQ